VRFACSGLQFQKYCLGVKIEREINKKIQEIIDNNIPAYLTTVTSVVSSAPIKLGKQMIIFENGKIYGTIGGGALEKQVIDYVVLQKPLETIKLQFDLSKKGLIRMVCGGSVEVLIERLHNPYLLYIIGAGHCGIELSHLANKTGFYVTVIDNRKEWANKEKHPSTDKIIATPYKNIEKHINFTDNTYIIVMTHNHQFDELILRKSLRKQHKYLGMIGSQNKVNDCFKRLTQQGFTRKQLSKVFAPIGFGIGSMTPTEIAISVMAQVIAVKNIIKTIPFNSNPLLR
jgi:xanthine dehydrogenase accessory factor